MKEKNASEKKILRVEKDGEWSSLRRNKIQFTDNEKTSQIQEIKDKVTTKYKSRLEDLKREATGIKHNLDLLKKISPENLNLDFEILEEDALSIDSWNSDSELIEKIQSKETKIK